jgi:hypothetical protein
MKRVSRSEILDSVEYEKARDELRQSVIAKKRTRRVALGSNMSVLFENHATVLFQIQEMIRTERIVNEAAIQHELDTYNELIPAGGELSATVFVEYPDAEQRDRMIVALAGLEQCFYIQIADRRSAARNETRGVLSDRTTAVHYLKFPLPAASLAALQAAGARVILGVDHPHYRAETELPDDTLEELRGDLRAIGPLARSAD